MIYSVNKKTIVESSLDDDKKLISESASSEDLGHDKENLVPNNTGFEGMSIEDYLGYNPDLGVARDEELHVDPVYGDFFRNPIAMKHFTEHFDYNDPVTLKTINTINEAEQGSVLTSLTSKLYDNIVSKVDDIDYGDIPATKGDITKLPNYPKLVECIELLRGILNEYKQDEAPVVEIFNAMNNVVARKDIFTRAFKLDVELPIIMYNNTVLSIINAVSYMIATSIEFMKTPNQDSFNITLDKVAYSKTKSNMLYNNLKKFNASCIKGEFDEAMEFVINRRVSNAMREGAALVPGAIIAGVAIVLNIIPILREMVFFFYYTRMRVSDFFDIQADLLQMNAYNVQNNDKMDAAKKERVVSKQLKIVELFRKIANKIAINGRKAEVETTKEITATSRKMKISDVSNELPDSVSALF